MNFGSKNGYKTYKTRKGRKKYVHTRVMEKKLGGLIRGGRVVHHINEDKGDNRPENLIAVTRGIHGRLQAGTPTPATSAVARRTSLRGVAPGLTTPAGC